MKLVFISESETIPAIQEIAILIELLKFFTFQNMAQKNLVKTIE